MKDIERAHVIKLLELKGYNYDNRVPSNEELKMSYLCQFKENINIV